MIPIFGHRGRGAVKSGVITALSMPFLVLTLAAALAFSAPAMAQGKGLVTGKGKATGKGLATGKGQGSGKATGQATGQGSGKAKGLTTGRGSGNAGVRVLDGIGGTVGTGGGLPPGLAKKNPLPYGLAKRGGNLPYGLAKGHPVPPGLAKRDGGNLPPGLRRR